MNPLFLRPLSLRASLATSLVTVLAASGGIAHAAHVTAPGLAAQAVVSSDRVIPGQDMTTHRAALPVRMPALQADRQPAATRAMTTPGSVERTGPEAMGSAGSAKIP